MKPGQYLAHSYLRASEVLSRRSIEDSGIANKCSSTKVPDCLSFLVMLTLATLASSAAVAQIHLDAPRDIANLLSPFLPAEADHSSQNKLQALLGEILATEGFFSPKFEFVKDLGSLQVRINPGPRTKVNSVDVVVDSSGGDETRASLLAEWKLPVGQPFRQSDWNTAKQDALASLLASEHAAAKLIDSEAEIDTEARTANLRAHYDAGPRYRFGELRITGLQHYSPDLIERYNKKVKSGTPYREDLLNELQSTLQSSPYFSSVQASIDTSVDAVVATDGTVTAPVILNVIERPPRRIAFGAGASSNTGARVEFNYHTITLFDQPWQMDGGLRLEQKKQTVYADVFLPPDTRGRLNSAGMIVERTDIEDLKTERYAFGAQTMQHNGSVEQRLSLNWQEERSHPNGGIDTTSRALVPGAMWTWRHVDNLLDPRDGLVLQAQIGGGAKFALSDQNFFRLHARYQQYIPLGRQDILALRGELGYTAAKSRKGIPQEYLFRTGGVGSVRGYSYQSLGIKDGSAVVGGRYLAVVSGEVTHWLNESWGVAGFVDAGDAVDDLKHSKLAVGYGVGARWRSPAGPIGFDVAYGQRTKGVQLHFSLVIPF